MHRALKGSSWIWMIAAAAATLVAAGLASRAIAGSGMIAATLTLVGIGVVWRLLAEQQHAHCAVGPQIRPLRASSLALIALGVQIYHAVEAADPIVMAIPWLATAPVAPVCMLGGVAGLAILSLSSDCRDEQLAAGSSQPGATRQ
jgi:hypothetical protein